MSARVGLLILALGFTGCGGGAEPRPEAASAPEAAPAQPAAAKPTPATTPKVPAHAHLEEWPGTENVTATGALTFAGQPDPYGLAHAASVGVKVVINARTAPEMADVGFDEAAECAKLGMKYVSIPIEPESFSREDVTRFAQALNEAGDAKVLVHCASSNRIGGLWAAYLALELGVPFEEALDHGRWAGLRRISMEDAVARVAGVD